MPEIDAHTPASFCWIELGTTDQQAAKAFYSAMFGWEFHDVPMGPGRTYTMFHIDGTSAGAAFQLEGASRWGLYVAVTDADAVSGKVEPLGGKVVHGPFDVSTSGKMSVIADPSGAVINIWQPASHKGLGVVGEGNSFCWADLSTPDQAKHEPQNAA